MLDVRVSAACKCPNCGYVLWSGYGIQPRMTASVACLPGCGVGLIDDNVVIVGDPVSEEELRIAAANDLFTTPDEINLIHEV